MKKLVVIFLIIFFGHINLNYAEETISPEVQNAISELVEKIKTTSQEDLMGGGTQKYNDNVNITKEKIKNLGSKAVSELIKLIKIKSGGPKESFRERKKLKISPKETDENVKLTFVRLEAMNIAIKMGDPEIAGTLIEVLEDRNNEPYNRMATLTNINVLIDELKKVNKNVDKKYLKNLKQIFDDSSEDIDVRQAAVIVYGNIGQNYALPELIKKLYDTTGDTAKYLATNALYGINTIETPEGENAILEGYLKQKGTFIDGTYVFLFKERKTKKAVPYLIEELEKIKLDLGNDARISRLLYMEALGEIGDTSAIPVLKAIANQHMNNIDKENSYNAVSQIIDAVKSLASLGNYELLEDAIKKVEIEGRFGKGDEKGLRNIYKKLNGHDFDY